LLNLLDGLPLAIAQAGAYLQESGVGLRDYLRFYEQQWSELMESEDENDTPLQDYLDRSVWTTWAISYQAIRDKHENTANLLLLWSFLDNKDFWQGLFAAACKASTTAAGMLAEWIGDIASSELKFSRAMQLLRNYSLIEEIEALSSYATHPVVHRWAYHYQGKRFALELGRLAVVAVGWAVPHDSARDVSNMQRRLLPHAQACSQWALERQIGRGLGINKSYSEVADISKEQHISLDAIGLLGMLYASQGKLAEAEQMYKRALQGYEEAPGPNHTSTLTTVNNLGILYVDQGKLAEAEQMYKRALQGKEEALGPNHTSTLAMVNNLGMLYADQGKLAEAEQMYKRALQGFEALGYETPHRLENITAENIGDLYTKQEIFTRAHEMYSRALLGVCVILGVSSNDYQWVRVKIANLGSSRGKMLGIV
jgi:Tfp pilus assembly protein PilF